MFATAKPSSSESPFTAPDRMTSVKSGSTGIVQRRIPTEERNAPSPFKANDRCGVLLFLAKGWCPATLGPDAAGPTTTCEHQRNQTHKSWPPPRVEKSGTNRAVVRRQKDCRRGTISNKQLESNGVKRPFN